MSKKARSAYKHYIKNHSFIKRIVGIYYDEDDAVEDVFVRINKDKVKEFFKNKNPFLWTLL
jgi:hypothetical protein